MEIRLIGAQMFHADGQRDKYSYDEGNSNFTQFRERA